MGLVNMKYLRRFNESVDHKIDDNLKQTIRDILLPISDMGNKIGISEDIDLFSRSPQLIIRVVSWTDEPLFLTDEIKDDFIRMKDYLELQGYNSVIALWFNPDRPRIRGDFDYFINNKLLINNLLFIVQKLTH
jgi:hypothetical protein